MTNTTTDIIHLANHAREPGAWPTLERNAYWHGKSMGVIEFERDQQYFLQLQQTLTRLAVGCGILCGLEVSPSGPTGVAVQPGAGVDGHGRLVMLPRAIELENLSDWLCPDDAPAAPGAYHLCLLYHECPTAQAPVAVTGCDTTVSCLPGAIEERFRFEVRPATPLCDADSRCRSCRSTGSTSCAPQCDDCVVLARFNWTGSSITSLTMDGRRTISSNAELSESTSSGFDDDTNAPALCQLWPVPGAELSRNGSPSDWAQWRRRPRIELTFDHPIDVDRVDDPDDWLRAWVVDDSADDGPGDGAVPDRATTGDDGAVIVTSSSLTFTRLGLTYLPGASRIDGQGRHRLVYTIESAAPLGSDMARTVLLQAMANDDTGPVSAGPIELVAHIEYPGTGLSNELRNEIWNAERFTTGVVDLETLTATPQPECFGDGYEGGRLHAAFTIPAVEEADLGTITGIYPTNGSRVSAQELPEVQIVSTSDVGDLEPRAWFITDSGQTELNLQSIGVSTASQNLLLLEFPDAFDETINRELDHIQRYSTDETLGGRGRILIVAPAHSGERGSVGGFAGTCLAETDVARIFHTGLTAADHSNIQPSNLRMPRSNQGGTWIHWTFYWEQDHGIII